MKRPSVECYLVKGILPIRGFTVIMREVFSVPKTTGIPAEYPKKECPEMPVPSGEDLLSVFFSDERTRIVALVASILGAGLFLYTSRITVVALLPAIILLGVAVLLACNSRHKLFSLIAIGLFTSLILSLRFDYLPWGDPWFEYGMILRILAYQSVSPSFYPAQLPVLHVIVASLSLFAGMYPLTLLKYCIPPLSIIAIVVVYRWVKEISSEETAFFAGLLLLSGTPYLHWTTQGVRETLGIALFILALYISFRSIRDQKPGFLAVSLLLIIGMVLTHHLSALIFLGVWIVISLVFLYLMCRREWVRRASLIAGFITTTTILAIIAWWIGRLEYEFSEFSGLTNSLFHSDYGIPLLLISVIILYLIPVLIPEKILALQTLAQRILIRKKIIYAVMIIGSVIGCILVINFVIGKSTFFLSYPIPMLFNGICIAVLALIGLYYFLEKDRLFVLAWVAVLSSALVLSMSGLVSFVDPLRLMEFLYIPLVIVAACGLSRVAQCIHSKVLLSVLLTALVLTSIVTTFPAVVFFGQPFEPGHPLYDNRSLVINHDPTEISGIVWLDANKAKGEIESDVYVGYPAQAIILADFPLTVQTYFSFVREAGYPQAVGTASEQHYLVILPRMKEYLEFGEDWMKEKQPLDETESSMIESECNRLYDNGNAVIYSFSTA